MYTLYSCLCLNEILKINPQTTVVKIIDSGMSGTLANIIPHQYLSLKDLYYGLMLPSGNDAACVLAYYYGSWMTRSATNGPAKSFRKDSIE